MSSNSIAVVTGAGSGIGKAITLAFAEQGTTVVAADLDLDAAKRTAEQNAAIVPMSVDVADRATVDALRDAVNTEVGVADILVNAAGWDRTDQFLNASTELAEKVVAINYLGPVHMASAFLPGMVEASTTEGWQGGRVINLASDAGRVGSAGESIYAGAKGGVIALSKSLAREMARHQITVNAVCPGPPTPRCSRLSPTSSKRLSSKRFRSDDSPVPTRSQRPSCSSPPPRRRSSPAR